MQILNYQFKPKLIPTIATFLLLPLLINLGLWQSNKADSKQAKQALFDQREKITPVAIGATAVNLEEIRYSHVITHGSFEPEFQIFLDNQMYEGQAGYHVITPLRISGSSMHILVNRGWIPVGTDRRILPVVSTPENEVEITGYAQDPNVKYFELSKPGNIKEGVWQKVWQNLDMKRYSGAVKFPLQPAIILLDPESKSGGFVREWPKPALRIDVNRGYALQWYFMSIALVIIYLVTNLKKVTPQGSLNAK
ncbi:MAG: SURF1 family protein [Gallionellaceae bacterium]